jgi:hypothetical protein
MQSQPLTRHLKDTKSPIAQFLKQQFPRTGSLTKEANLQLKAVNTILPPYSTSRYPYGSIGMAIDYRIRYSFALTPSNRLMAKIGADLLTINQRTGIIGDGVFPYDVAASFFEHLDETLHALQPVGRRLEPAAEQTLARCCYVLSLFEDAYRNLRNAYQYSPLLIPNPIESVEELLSIPQDAWIDDLCAMSWLFYDRYHNRLSLPSVLNPIFQGCGAVSGSDADLIVEGCLIELKATIEPEIKSNTLWQLAGYVLLDSHDAYKICSVGTYLPRQGELFQWSIGDFLHQLTGNEIVSLAQLRQEFSILCHDSLT